MATSLISRKDALAQGLKFYATGKPCKRGHDGQRYASSGTCVACHPARRKNPDARRADTETAKRYWFRNTEKLKKLSRERYAANPEPAKAMALDWYDKNRERVAETARKRRECDAQRIREQRRARRLQQNPEKLAEASKRWYEANREAAIAASRNRKAQRKGAPGKHTLADIKDILSMQRHLCAYCRSSLKHGKFHIDHITAISRGGTNDRRNLQALCPPCNQRKSCLDPADFARSIGLLV